MSDFKDFVKTTFFGRILLIPWRFKNAMFVAVKPLKNAVLWSICSREHYNYTYDLESRNLEYLTAFLAHVTAKPYELLEKYLNEILEDEDIKQLIIRGHQTSPERFIADLDVKYGRRIGWYALIRALKPKVVVETGVDKGLGSCVIAAALRQNARENCHGKLIAIDINPKAGYLIQEPYSSFVSLVIKDSIEALNGLDVAVDFFIHDSNHSVEHEAMEYQALKGKLSAGAMVLSDNSEHSSELLDFARKTERKFLFFAERPKDHWWPGEGIGVAW